MAKPNHMQFFLDTFIKVNVETYKADAPFVAKLKALTLATTKIENITPKGAGKFSAKVSSVAANFVGDNQAWEAGDLTEVMDKSKSVKTVATIADLDNETVPGLYLIGDATKYTFGILTAIGADAQTSVETILADACNYLMPAKSVVIAGGVATVTTDTFGGPVTVKTAKAEVLVIPPTDYGAVKTNL